MNFAVGDRLRVDGDDYDVLGKVVYRNLDDGCVWAEYRLYSSSMRQEKWLSCDDIYHEYSISEVCRDASTAAYHQVDGGVEQVIEVWGDVDVEVGDRAIFTEFEDITEEKIISWEKWDDGMEQSKGYYLDEYEIQRVSSGGGYSYSFRNDYDDEKKSNKLGGLVVLLALIVPGLMVAFGTSSFAGGAEISKYLENSSRYSYITSITGTDSEKADVYQSLYNVDQTATDIIDAIEGDTTDVQQNQEDGDDSIAILTENEYCLIYNSEDNKTLVQVSTRKYAYANDDDPYRSRQGTRRYYRRFYYSRGYYSDMGDYSSVSSPYRNYSDRMLDPNISDSYNSYAYNVRRSSTTSRSSSGGGLSGGK